MTKRTRTAVGLAAALALCVWTGAAVWRAVRALGHAETEVASEWLIRVSNVELRPATTAVEQIGAPSRIHDAALYDGKLYAAGAGGLFTDAAQYRVGELLPPAPLTSMHSAITAQNPKAELWIGTAGEGMLAFDGHRFRHVRPEDSRFRNVTAVLGLNVGRVLFGTEKGGVLAFDGRSLSVLHESLRDLHVTALAGDDTDLWIGTIDRGLLHWRGGQVATVDNLPDRHVMAIAVGSNGAVYAGTALGIAEIRSDRMERVIAPDVFARSLLARGDAVYAGTLDAGVYEIPVAGARPRFLETPSSVRKLFAVAGELLTVADDGVFRARSGTPVFRPTDAILADRNISALGVDGVGQLWVGYFDRGLDILDPSFSRARHLEDGHLFCVNRISHDRETAVATANGLVLFDGSGQKKQVLGRDQGLIANHVTDVVVNGAEMIAATPAGLSFIAPDGIRSLYAFHGLVNNHTYALGLVNGNVLAGTLGGLSVLQTGTVRASYTTSNSPLRHNWITAIASSGSDAFVGTYGAGVVKLASDGAWETFADMPRGTEINPGALTATATHVYAGTLGKGLMVFGLSDRRWRSITHGLPSLNVTAVHVSNGRVFAGTDNGLVRLP